MARPPKRGLNYSTWGTNILDVDEKLDKLIGAQGPAGFLVYFWLCQRAYGNEGYYFRWSMDDADSTARRIGGGIKPECVTQAVRTCLKIGLFDDGLFLREGIITSRAIQRGYLQGVKRRTTPIYIIREYWLLETENVAGCIFCTKKEFFVYNNTGFCVPKPGFGSLNEMKQNEMKQTPHNPPNNGTVETVENVAKNTEQRKETVRRVLALHQARTGINMMADNNTRAMLYGLLNQGYRPAELMDAVDKATAAGHTAPNEIFGARWFNRWAGEKMETEEF